MIRNKLDENRQLLDEISQNQSEIRNKLDKDQN